MACRANACASNITLAEATLFSLARTGGYCIPLLRKQILYMLKRLELNGVAGRVKEEWRGFLHSKSR